MQYFGGKLEIKRSHERPRRKWENIVIRNLREVVWEGVNWVHLAQDKDQWRAFVKTVMNLLVP
jgi:hypothetical protein